MEKKMRSLVSYWVILSMITTGLLAQTPMPTYPFSIGPEVPHDPTFLTFGYGDQKEVSGDSLPGSSFWPSRGRPLTIPTDPLQTPSGAYPIPAGNMGWRFLPIWFGKPMLTGQSYARIPG